MRYRLHSALSIAHGKYTRALARIAQPNGLGYGQPKVLEYISTNPDCTQIDICRAWDVDKSTMSGLVTRMLRDGQIDCERDWLDRRRAMLRLTSKGKACWAKVEQELEKLEEAAWRGIPEEEQEAFMRTICRICENLEQEEKRDGEA